MTYLLFDFHVKTDFELSKVPSITPVHPFVNRPGEPAGDMKTTACARALLTDHTPILLQRKLQPISSRSKNPAAIFAVKVEGKVSYQNG